ncbi:protein BANP-like [Rhincodon typus]|uniref:protein BANP-like n=1 Tax=Rhincodon typus TaxID=259920 RepID=UPI00202E52EE|nr:protein BANP-like [Rhincodon typus]
MEEKAELKMNSASDGSACQMENYFYQKKSVTATELDALTAVCQMYSEENHQIDEWGKLQDERAVELSNIFFIPFVFKGNLQIHQVHVSQDGQVLQGAQLIAVASAEHPTSGVDGSPLQGSDIQVQYVQLAPVTDHNAAAQGTESLAATIQPEMQIEHGAIQIQQGENGEVVQIQMPVNTVSS